MDLNDYGISNLRYLRFLSVDKQSRSPSSCKELLVRTKVSKLGILSSSPSARRLK